jgi:hypothetical protein
MTITTTLRPNADVNRVNAITFPSPDNAAMYPVLSDNGDGSYVMLYVIDGAGFMVELGTTAVPSSQRIARVRMRVRWKCSGNGYANFAYGLVDSANNALAGDSVSVIKQLAPVTITGAWQSRAPDGGPWTQAKLDGLRARVIWIPPDIVNQTPGEASTSPCIVEMYVDVELNAPPSMLTYEPSGTVTQTAQPTISVGYYDDDGDPMDAYEAKVFNASQYGAAGFSPDTSPALWETGVVASTNSLITQQIGVPLPNGSYRAYVRVRQGGSIMPGLWSAWGALPFVQSLVPPATPSVSVATDAANARNVLTLVDRQNLLSSTDAGIEDTLGTWSAGHGATIARLVTAQSENGGAVIDMTTTAADYSECSTGQYAVAPGRSYAARAAFRKVTTARQTRLDIRFLDGGGSFLDRVFGDSPIEGAGWTASHVLAQAPVNAVTMQLIARVEAPGVGEHHYIDGIALITNTDAPLSFAWSPGGLVSAARFVVERSDDGGQTWLPIRTYAPGLGFSDLSGVAHPPPEQSLTVYDYEVERGKAIRYRVQVVAKPNTSTVLSSAYGVSPLDVVLPAKGWFLKSTTDPTYNIPLYVHSDSIDASNEERLGIHRPLGRSRPVLLSDIIGAETWSFELAFLDEATYDAFEALRGRRETMLLQSPYRMHTYVRCGPSRLASFVTHPSGIAKRVVKTTFLEVDPP